MPVSAEMIEHLQGTATVGVFLDITAKDGDIIRVWNGTRNKVVDDEIYYAYPVAPSQLQAANGLKADNLEIMAIYSGLFTAATCRAKQWQGARAVYRTMNFKDLSMGYAERRVTLIGKTEIGKYSAKLELNSLSSQLGQSVGRSYNIDCDVDEFGGARCGKSLAGNTVDGYKIKINATISAVTNRQQFTVTFSGNIFPANAGITTAPDDFYRRGKIKFTSGPNNGLEEQILVNVGNGLTLYLPPFYAPTVGTTLELTAGCDRKLLTCGGKFANAENHQGFNDIPGRSKLFKIPE